MLLKGSVIDMVHTKGIKRAKELHDKQLQALHRTNQILDVKYYKHTYQRRPFIYTN